MTAYYWGFEVTPALYDQIRETARAGQQQPDDGLAAWEKEAFGVISQLIFEGIEIYYQSVLNADLPPLVPGEKPEDAVQALGLGLTFWAGRAMQGRSPGELRDLAHYMGMVVRPSPAPGAPMLAVPLTPELADGIRQRALQVIHAEDLETCRMQLKNAVLEIAESALQDYYNQTLASMTDEAHKRQVIRFGLREARQMLGDVMAQLSAEMPKAHLAHFARFVEGRLMARSDPS